MGVGVELLFDSINLEPSQDLTLDRNHRNPQCLLEQATWEVTGFLTHGCLGQHGGLLRENGHHYVDSVQV